MTQQSGSQFVDDLTVGIDEGESFATDSIDLLGVGGDESSPIARLKTIILSIDWEINDDILQQLDDELHDLGEIWTKDKIKQVYVQGLSKIGRYIYKEKAGAHPNSIKLLITFYHNLEKIVTNDDTMGEDEKKQLLLADVKKFDQLKSQIGKPSPQTSSSIPVAKAQRDVSVDSDFNKESQDSSELKTLKALVLGIDWEINDREMQQLGSEVKRLEGNFGQNKPKLILLQGIGALSSYINKKRSQSNSRAFSLLRSFYDSLEKISTNELSAPDQKQLLLSEVAKFNEFKANITRDAASPAAVVSDVGSSINHGDSPAALSDEDDSQEPNRLEDDVVVADDVESRLASVFGDEDEESGESSFKESDKDKALAGVNVETEADDDSDEEALPYEAGTVAPALAEVDEDSSFSVEKLADDLSVAAPSIKPEAIVGDDVEADEEFSLEDVGDTEEGVETEEKLQGVEVETEADDDSEEELLPMKEGELAPALSGADDGSGFNADNVAAEFDKSDSEAIEDRLGAFFDDEVATSSEGWVTETSEQLLETDDSDSAEADSIVAALSEIDDDSSVAPFSDNDENSTVAALNGADEGSVVAALSDVGEDNIVAALSDAEEESVVATLSDAAEDNVVAALSDVGEDNIVAALSDTEEENVVAALSDADEDSVVPELENVAEAASLFDDEEIDEEESIFVESEPVPALFDSDEETILIDESEDELRVTESAEAEVEDGLSFLDDDIADDTEKEPEEILYEDTEAEDVEESPDILDDEEAEFITEEDETAEEAIVYSFVEDAEAQEEETDLLVESAAEDAPQTVEEAALAFFDDDDTDDETVEEVITPIDIIATRDEEIAFEVDSDDIAEDDEIEFTVPGDDATALAEVAIETSTHHEEAEFSIPGETVVPIAAVATGALITATIEEVKTVEDEDVVFEAVADDTELDLLPDEEYDDSLMDEDVEAVEDDDAVEFTEVEEESDTGRYESLSILVTAIGRNVGEDGIQDILTEINQLRSGVDTSFVDKTFLQLLSTVSQFIEQNREDFHALELMQEIVSGLEMSDSSERSVDEIQEKLFSCTSQILLLQAKEITAQATHSLEATTREEHVEPVGGADVTDVDSETSNYKAMGEDEQLASFVQKELTDIRKLFIEEIGSLRKELAEKL